MDLNMPTLWWLAAGVLVAAELASGTFYLLMVALGCVAGALAAHVGLPVAAQIIVGAAVGTLTTVPWHLYRSRRPQSAAAQSNRDVLLDIGQAVWVEAWLPDGTARVQYRGASWAVRYAGAGTPVVGGHVIAALHGNELQLVLPSPQGAMLSTSTSA